MELFELRTPSGVKVQGEYEGNTNSKKVIIFSHGFGVTRDSHGMFIEIGDLLKKDYLIIRFDYTTVKPEENWTKVFPYSTQVEMLREVFAFAEREFAPIEVNIIAHSMGCIIVGLAKLDEISKIVLLAAPPSSPYERLKEYFSKRPETKIDENGISVIKRSDGSITYVDKDFWGEMKGIDPMGLYLQLGGKSKVTFVRALSDQVIVDSNYLEISDNDNIDFKEINGNHDFEDESRKDLLDIVEQAFAK